jgi:5'-nucleotidase
MKNKPTILVTNDDGITSEGIRHLVNLMKTIGEVIVVAPNSPQSGKGHAITLEEPLRIHKVNIFEGIEAYECSGTPVDCVKLAKNVLFKNKTIDLCVSGINHGSNAGINVIYSGTMSAAMEASLEKIDSIGFSLLDYGHDADFSHANDYILLIVNQILEKNLQGSQLLNVNIPKKSNSPLKGIKICSQGEGEWIEDFVVSKDPRGIPYYWMTGEFAINKAKEGTDFWALENNYISIVPCSSDLTEYDEIVHLKYLEDA